MTDTEIKSITEELKIAAAKLRETAAKATRGPWITHPTMGQSGGDTQTWTVGLPFCDGGAPEPCEPGCAGDVVTTGREGCEEDFLGEADAAWMALVNPLLAEPLAAWLEEIARQYDMPPCDKPDGCCNNCERRDDFVYAHTLAQLINGSDRG